MTKQICERCKRADCQAKWDYIITSFCDPDLQGFDRDDCKDAELLHLRQAVKLRDEALAEVREWAENGVYSYPQSAEAGTVLAILDAAKERGQ